MVTSPNKGYNLQATGANPGTWGADLNTNSLTVIDSNIGGYQPVALAGANVTLTATQAQNCIFRLTGTLSADITLTIPITGFLYVDNFTTGNFQVKLSNGANTTAITPINTTRQLISDAVNGMRSVGLPAPGTSAPFRGTAGGGTALHRSMLGEYLLEDGSAVSRTVFGNLFAAIGTLYGAGDGSTTFNLPDTRGRVNIGLDNQGGVAAGRMTNFGGGIGGAGGEQSHQLILTETPSHNHTGTTGNDSPDHTHNYITRAGFASAGPGGNPTNLYQNDATIPSGGASARHQHSIASAGSDGVHNNVQPGMLCFFMIKT